MVRGDLFNRILHQQPEGTREEFCETMQSAGFYPHGIGS
jgi:hypothetical protein